MMNKPVDRHEAIDDEDKLSDLDKFVRHIKENPLLYVAGVAIVIVAGFAGGFHRYNEQKQERDVMTNFAKALEEEDPALRASTLEELAGENNFNTPKAVYMMGEAAYEAQDYDRAKKAFERVRTDFPADECVPKAVEGLGNIAENEDNYEAALKLYEEILTKWPTSVTGRRQKLGIGRCQEKLGNLAEAVKFYTEQTEDFAESSAASEAQGALNLLARTNPELFPDEEVAIFETPLELTSEEDASDAKAEDASSDAKPEDAAGSTEKTEEAASDVKADDASSVAKTEEAASTEKVEEAASETKE